MDHLSPYVKKQLIAYIGNKRRLIPSLHALFRTLSRENSITTMLDPFAGSGAVSRLGKLLGFKVMANDWEEYSRVINRCHLCVSPQQARGLFRRQGGLEALLQRLNRMDHDPPVSYFSRYYAPRSTEDADYRQERLFYTRENALFLDRVRGWIEEQYPQDADGGPNRRLEREVLIAMLIYEAATHANTSGVFKACHKGYGGHGGDALSRIMHPMELEYPVLQEGPAAEVGCSDAAEWVSGRSADICYLDPPYTIHQYGSNYHILNSVARWDRPEAALDLGPDGRLKRKAGIRSDWTQTRSPYCSRSSAARALADLVDRIDAGSIVLSYNSDGLIGLEELTDILSAAGRLELYAEEYTQYRGGKQGLNRTNLTTEFQLVVNRKRSHRSRDTELIRRYMRIRQLGLLLKSGFNPERLRTAASVQDGSFRFDAAGRVVLPLECGWRFDPEAVAQFDAEQLGDDELTSALEILKEARFRDNREEAETLLQLLEKEEVSKTRRAMAARFFVVLKKLAHKKYRHLFEELYRDADAAFRSWDWTPDAYRRKLAETGRIARRRFSG